MATRRLDIAQLAPFAGIILRVRVRVSLVLDPFQSQRLAIKGTGQFGTAIVNDPPETIGFLNNIH
ncbi:hypothetical protein B9Z51_07040 [Limnohabitans sp. T6-5]|nr:hypothetical protein B9Z51_07040 [Limnohabitans sp. T6-5]